MAAGRRKPSVDPHIRHALRDARKTGKPIAFVLAGHNGSGKSTLWNERLADRLRIPLVNADRLILSILPLDERTGRLRDWATKLRDGDVRWQQLAQRGVQQFVSLVKAQRMPFALETVFSHWRQRDDGTIESKADQIVDLQQAGYFVVLLFVGLTSPELSRLRVETRRTQGGHVVPVGKLNDRFPRTQKAIGHAAPIADRTLMFDNSRDFRKAFTLARAQRGARVLYDCRRNEPSSPFTSIARLWLDKVVPEGPVPTDRSGGTGRTSQSR